MAQSGVSPSALGISQSSTHAASSTLAVRTKARDLWDLAVSRISDKHKAHIDFARSDRNAILQDVLCIAEAKRQECLKKRWKLWSRKGEPLFVRDVLEKIVGWIDIFKAVGDTAAQYDPTHASLPWAGIRFLLQALVNDIKVDGSMLEGLSLATNLIVRYAIFEELYVRTGLAGLTGTNVEESLVEIEAAQVGVDACAKLVDKEPTLLGTTNHALFQLDATVKQVGKDSESSAASTIQKLDQLNKAIQVTELHDFLGLSQRLQFYRWLSTVPHISLHKMMVKTCLHGTGEWLLGRVEFKQWINSSTSSILWLHGIPGSGKSMLVATVIRFLGEQMSMAPSGKLSMPIAFFYCARDSVDPQRADPEEVLRSILKQLASAYSESSIYKPVWLEYREREAESQGSQLPKLTLDETVEHILSLLELNPATIVIDALDECDPTHRSDLILAIEDIINRAGCMVKFFVSSRDDGDIVARLNNSPNVFIRSEDNGPDINRFVQFELDRVIREKKLLRGSVSQGLREHIIRVLQSGSQGMFRWVSLQIQNLCNHRRMKVEADVKEELGRLPQGLKDSYDLIYEQIMISGKRSRLIARRVLAWLLCAQRPLKSLEMISAVSQGISALIHEELLDICCNLVIFDKDGDVFRLAHLSVREYLEANTTLDFSPHALIETHHFRDYANIYWPVHFRFMDDELQLQEGTKAGIDAFLRDGGFNIWISEMPSTLHKISWCGLKETYWTTVRRAPKHAIPVLVASAFGLCYILKGMMLDGQSRILDSTNYMDQTGLHLATHAGEAETVEYLLLNGADPNAQDYQKVTALHHAIRREHFELWKLLTSYGADMNLADNQSETPLYLASISPNFASYYIIHGINTMEMLNLFQWQLLKQNLGLIIHLPHQTLKLISTIVQGYGEHERMNYSLRSAETQGFFYHRNSQLEFNALLQQILQKQVTHFNHTVSSTYLESSVLTLSEKPRGFFISTVLEIFLKYGADANFQDLQGNSAVHYAINPSCIHSAATLEMLMKYGAQLNRKGYAGDSALHAILKDQGEYTIDILRTLYKFDPHVFCNTNDLGDDSAVHLAINSPGPYSVPILDLVLSCGAEVNSLNSLGSSAVSVTLKKAGDYTLEILDTLLKYKAKFEEQDLLRELFIHYISSKNPAEYTANLLHILIKHEVKHAKSGNSLLHMIIEIQSDRNYHLLTESDKLIKMYAQTLDMGADVNATNNRGETPLMMLLKKGSSNFHQHPLSTTCAIAQMIATSIITYNAQINLADENGDTALHHLLRQTHHRSCMRIPPCKFLLYVGADAHMVNNSGRTALHLAVTSVHVFGKHKADIEIAVEALASWFQKEGKGGINAVDKCQLNALDMVQDYLKASKEGGGTKLGTGGTMCCNDCHFDITAGKRANCYYCCALSHNLSEITTLVHLQRTLIKYGAIATVDRKSTCSTPSEDCNPGCKWYKPPPCSRSISRSRPQESAETSSEDLQLSPNRDLVRIYLTQPFMDSHMQPRRERLKDFAVSSSSWSI
ncbi:hypothetical protein DFH27DRAFT_524663 [Peziza echinospora]|nr:hypothetical protein DFH27DRAFT_524663 [Peziza echinospora]